MSDLLQAVGLFVTGAATILLVLLAVKIARGNRSEYERNRQRLGSSVVTAIRGEVPTVSDGTRDYRVAAGIAVDRKKNEWVEQGRLSSEAIAGALRQPIP